MKKGEMEVNKIITWVILLLFLVVVIIFVRGKFNVLVDMFLSMFK